ncbi:transcription-repair coupling factor [Gloeobacter kilaueensis]|uniref:Transcription-repair-coupling factor n=1 Tax=Gloeobacter kilaueensis (strain ATCC BAA-2537 / CCAP 1431/1 / ULC 316 / JS1) TaxID=1183438 RepID=U5QIE7_GLOK1|nr:transcription-repair coupling factor [Gloeobacter kilaueensis]AGY58762.1 transcription-repair coupling factor [Gloeobacter kilaueensis JS1]
MPLTALVQSLKGSPFVEEIAQRLLKSATVRLQGGNRVARGIAASALARRQGTPLLVVTANLEEAARWSAQLETMGWESVYLYPSSEATPYEPFDPEEEVSWGELQVLAELTQHSEGNWAIVCTSRALQPHLPPPEDLSDYCLTIEAGQTLTIERVSAELARLGYSRVPQVEGEGQFSRRGDILDCFPVSAEMPVRIEWFGDELEKIREFDPASQRSLDPVDGVSITPVGFGAVVLPELQRQLTPARVAELPESWQQVVRTDIQENRVPEGLRRWLGLAFDPPASLVDYLPTRLTVCLDEPEQIRSIDQRWFEAADEQWLKQPVGPPLHIAFEAIEALLKDRYSLLELRELASEGGGFQLGGRPLPSVPHQFGTLAEHLRQYRAQGLQIWMLSAQPSRAVALLAEHDCPAQFIPNPQDQPALEKAQTSRTPIALKYSGLAEMEGSVLSTLRTVLVTDREFFGQRVLATPNFVRKRRRAGSRQIDLDKLNPGDFVVHRNHGIGRFLKLEKLAVSGSAREYLVIEYADGILRVAADQMNSLSRYRSTGGSVQLSRMGSKSWEKTKQKVRKSIQKIAFDLLELYARRSQQKRLAFPPDQPWQREMEDSFPYPLTPDQARAIQEVKADMESERPMDRLVCGDVGFGKTEVAIRAAFKAVTSGLQCAVLVPTTVLAQQHYHTFKERFAPYPISVGLLNRFRTPAEKKDLLARLATGELDLVIGTHQLLGSGVHFRNLGLLIIDEEQRFGVAQKEKIKTLKTQVDVLTLTATPIPRTLYMSLSGVREMSLITTPPPSRRPIKTHLAPYDPEHVRTAILQELGRGGQVFYVYNRVEDIQQVAARLQAMLPMAKIGVAHGQMDEGELESTMLAFSGGEYDILVCTTIIESGLDIPRVNTILVENAHQFGLAQLYQLRGRVGRSGVQAHAWMFYKQEDSLTDEARKRLRAIQEFTQLGSGYQLAMRDMEIRGVGNLLGAEQSGQVNQIGFDLYMELLEEAIQEIRGRKLPKVEDTQIDLRVTAFIPADYIVDLEQKMRAYRQVALATDRHQLQQVALEWTERYGPLPVAAQQLLRVMELKQVARALGFSRIRPEATNVVLETPMEAPAWEQIAQSLPAEVRGRFFYQPGKVTVRNLGILTSAQQLENLVQWLDKVQLPSLEIAV